MAKQTINPGTAPTGAGGDTFRSGSAKLQANDDEIYNYLGDGANLNKLGTAAFKNTGTQAGNVMEVGAFGLGTSGGSFLHAYNDAPKGNGFIVYSDLDFTYGIQAVFATNGTGIQIVSSIDNKTLRYRHNYGGGQ